MMRKDDVSGTSDSGVGGQSMNRPSAIKSAPTVWTTFHRMDRRRSVSRTDVSGVDSFMRACVIGLYEHGDMVSGWSR